MFSPRNSISIIYNFNLPLKIGHRATASTLIRVLPSNLIVPGYNPYHDGRSDQLKSLTPCLREHVKPSATDIFILFKTTAPDHRWSNLEYDPTYDRDPSIVNMENTGEYASAVVRLDNSTLRALRNSKRGFPARSRRGRGATAPDNFQSIIHRPRVIYGANIIHSSLLRSYIINPLIGSYHIANYAARTAFAVCLFLGRAAGSLYRLSPALRGHCLLTNVPRNIELLPADLIEIQGARLTVAITILRVIAPPRPRRSERTRVYLTAASNLIVSYYRRDLRFASHRDLLPSDRGPRPARWPDAGRKLPTTVVGSFRLTTTAD
ncbi:hypothetical protein EVAR_54884_1 [Eumeta japonica]|uniref:Uncharacterized protein n=1 Tax=Eumeta variegata TaxID=151549 RepID=A0A4C2A1K7_EUMVA|nr:hypothetical protein EVAR_54884_1 [Eumeta japonica]